MSTGIHPSIVSSLGNITISYQRLGDEGNKILFPGTYYQDLLVHHLLRVSCLWLRAWHLVVKENGTIRSGTKRSLQTLFYNIMNSLVMGILVYYQHSLSFSSLRIILLRALGPGEERENGIGNSLRSRVLFSRAQQHNIRFLFVRARHGYAFRILYLMRSVCSRIYWKTRTVRPLIVAPGEKESCDR